LVLGLASVVDDSIRGKQCNDGGDDLTGDGVERFEVEKIKRMEMEMEKEMEQKLRGE
jgi:hypothetical protein